MKFTFTLSESEARKTLAKKLTFKELLELILINTNTYSNWDIDLQLAEALVKRVKEGYIDKYRDEDIPQVLRPLLVQAISDNLAKNNEKNKNITLNDVSGEAELKAIKLLREYKSIDYDDAVNLFCDGYDFAKKQTQTEVDLSSVDTEKLLTEIKNRL